MRYGRQEMKAEAEYFAFVAGPVPTRSHRQGSQVGTENANAVSAVPAAPTVPTGEGEERPISAVADPNAFEERAAIIEHDADLPRQHAETRAAREQGFKDADDLHGAVVARWATEIDRLAELPVASREASELLRQARAFIADGWALQATRLGWDVHRLFGLCPVKPWARLDRKGAVFGGTVQAVTAEAFIHAGGLRRYRATVNNDGGAVPIWELAEGLLTGTEGKWIE